MNKAAGAAQRKLRNKIAGGVRVERRLKAFELKVQGLTLEEIGRRLGVTAMTISADVNERIRELEAMATNEEALLAHWHMAMMRLEAIFKHHFTLSEEGNAHSAAICLRAVEQMAKLAGLESGKPEESQTRFGHSHILDRVRESSPALMGRLESLCVAKKVIEQNRTGDIGRQGAEVPMPATEVEVEVC